ncbi:MAG: excalibur calcium-binding domain-containing protein [Aeromonas sp.]
MKLSTLLLVALCASLPTLTPAYAAGHSKQSTTSYSKSSAKPNATKHKTKRSAKRTASTAGAGTGTGAFSCSELPRHCKGMSSCEQATFALKKCGRKKLDRDNDGIPCENVCG